MTNTYTQQRTAKNPDEWVRDLNAAMARRGESTTVELVSVDGETESGRKRITVRFTSDDASVRALERVIGEAQFSTALAALELSDPCVNAYPDYARRSFVACGHDAEDHDDGCQRCPCSEYRVDGAAD